MFEELF